MSRIRHVFLDRDGTVIKNAHYLGDPAGVELLPGVGPALAALAQAGLTLYLVTNQSGLGRGFFNLADFWACQDRLSELLAVEGAALQDTVFCPHIPEEGCFCRKPSVGMWHDLRDRHNLGPDSCAMIGDSLADVLFGRQAGLGLTILVLTGHGADTAGRLGLPGPDNSWLVLKDKKPDWPDVIARDLPAAVEYILS